MHSSLVTDLLPITYAPILVRCGWQLKNSLRTCRRDRNSWRLYSTWRLLYIICAGVVEEWIICRRFVYLLCSPEEYEIKLSLYGHIFSFKYFKYFFHLNILSIHTGERSEKKTSNQTRKCQLQVYNTFLYILPVCLYTWTAFSIWTRRLRDGNVGYRASRYNRTEVFFAAAAEHRVAARR